MTNRPDNYRTNDGWFNCDTDEDDEGTRSFSINAAVCSSYKGDLKKLAKVVEFIEEATAWVKEAPDYDG